MVLNARLMVLAVVILLTACGPAGPAGTGSAGGLATQPRAPKTISIGLDEDVKNFWDSVTGGGGTGARELANIINAHLVAISADGSPTPRLLAELPSVERGTWRILPDGKMETTYKLRSNGFWHDGTPFTADDIVFSWRVNRDPEVPNANQEAVRLIERMDVIDPTTVVASSSELYPFAERLEHRELFTLPRHLLEKSYQEGAKDAFLSQPYFSEDYVGMGPYRVVRWERGSHLELAAFDRYFMGRPNIDTVVIRFIPDLNTMLANLKARSIQSMVTLGSASESFNEMMDLKREWEAAGYGTVLKDPISYRFMEPQKFHNPQPRDLTDPRVRQALLLAIDRPELVRVVFGEDGVVSDSWVHPAFPTYPRLQDAITRYPYDLRRASALMEEAGWRPGADGVLEKGRERFALTMRDYDGQRDSVIMADAWRKIGVVGSYELRTALSIRDREDRATYSGVEIVSNPMGLASVVRKIAGYNTPTADNRWTGTNRGGYTNPAWDQLERRMLVALEEPTRLEIERELLRIASTDLPLLPIYFRFDVIPVGGGLTGVVANTGVAHRGFILHTWNIHEWDVKTG